jgi:hypothetical protein
MSTVGYEDAQSSAAAVPCGQPQAKTPSSWAEGRAQPSPQDLQFVLLDEHEWPPPLGKQGLRSSRYERVLAALANDLIVKLEISDPKEQRRAQNALIQGAKTRGFKITVRLRPDGVYARRRDRDLYAPGDKTGAR